MKLLLCLVVVVVFVSQAFAAVDKPDLLWAYAGQCNGYSCERGWYSSPAVAQDPVSGEWLVVSAAYSIQCIYASNGTVRWSRDTPEGGRVWPGVAIADLDKDGKLEVIVASDGGWVSVYNLTDGANYYDNYPYQPDGVSNEFRSLSVADINQDGGLEIVLGRAYGGHTNTFALTYYGSPLSGFPVGTDQSKGYTWGVYNANIGIADMDKSGDSYEIITPSDVHYVCAYYSDGSPYPANTSVYTDRPNWGLVPVWIDLSFEYNNDGNCYGDPSTADIRTNFANGPVAIGDLDNDGTNEYVFVGDTYECGDTYVSVFNGIHVLKSDRTRWKNTGLGYDWTTVPDPATGPPLVVGQYDIIEDNQNNPALGDLDNDDELEMVYPSYDGKMHAYGLDRQEKPGFPFDLASLSSGSSTVYASEPAIVDLDGDNFAEIIFGVWTRQDSNPADFGYLVILDYQANLLWKIPLPQPQICTSNPSKCPKWNGVLGAPTVKNFDSNPDVEIVVLTAYSGTVAYRVNNTANANIMWGTGRGNIQRTASATIPSVGSGTPPSPQKNPSSAATLSAIWLNLAKKFISLF